jgi:hypothetical protein
MQGYHSFLLVQRLNDLSSQLSDLQHLRLKVEEAERRARAVPALPSSPSTQLRLAGQHPPERVMDGAWPESSDAPPRRPSVKATHFPAHLQRKRGLSRLIE